MSAPRYGSTYLMGPTWDGDLDTSDQFVIDSYPKGLSEIDTAIELWQLAGNEAQANEIKALIDRIYERDSHIVEPEALGELIHLLSGLDDALDRSPMFDKGRIRVEFMDEVRRKSKMLDVADTRGDDARAAAWEGMTRVSALRNILREALDRGLRVLFG